MDRQNIIFNIFWLFLFSFCGLSVGEDLEIEGRIRMKTEFIKRMKDTMFLDSHVFRSVKDLNGRFAKPDYKSVNALTKYIMRRRSERRRSLPENTKITDLTKYQERVQKKGLKSLTAIAEHLQKKLEVSEKLVKDILYDVGAQYVSKILSYFIFLAKKKPYYDIDKEYLILDMVNIAHFLITSVEKTLLNRVLEITKNTSKEDKQILTETIHIYNMNNKKEEMKHICATMDVCRPCPGFSDYIVKILTEALKMYDDKFKHFVVKSFQLLISKRAFFESILRDEIIEWFIVRTINVVNMTVTDIREVISLLRSGLSQRQRMLPVADKNVKIRTKASRILTDILDKALNNSGDEYFYVHLERTISYIQDWSISKRNDIDFVLQTFINQMVAYLKFDLNSLAKDEIKTLADIIFYGSSVGNEYIEEYLMEKGSKFVKGLSPLRSQLFILH